MVEARRGRGLRDSSHASGHEEKDNDGGVDFRRRTWFFWDLVTGSWPVVSIGSRHD